MAIHIQIGLLFTLLIYGSHLGQFGAEGGHHHKHHHHHHHHHRKHGHHDDSISYLGIEKLFVFGDSYADTGNVPFMWEKQPYGITFPGKPGGRYSDGHILTDFVAEYLGLKSPVPYTLMESHKEKLHYGMNFAYGGAGVFKTLYPVPNISVQVDFFEQVINESLYTTYDLEKSLALVTLSGNDYYAYIARGGTPIELIINLMPKVVNELGLNLKRISELGVKRIAVGTVPPLGCVPAITQENGYKTCNVLDDEGALIHGDRVTTTLSQLNNESLATQFAFLDIDTAFTNIINNKGDPKENLKLPTPLMPCCHGVSANYSCGDVDSNGNKMYTLCEDRKSAFFWDDMHPTEAGWRAVVLALRPTLKEICGFS